MAREAYTQPRYTKGPADNRACWNAIDEGSLVSALPNHFLGCPHILPSLRHSFQFGIIP